MGKINKFLAVVLAVVCLFALSATASAAELYHLKIEQVDTNLPQMVAYLYVLDSSDKLMGDTLSAENVSATVGGEKVKVESVELQKDSGHGVRYYYLLDVSHSAISQFNAMKAAIKNHISTKSDNDRIIVITFGKQVAVALDGSESA